MKLFIPDIEVGPTDGFAPDKDIFGRKKFGEQIASLFAKVDDPLVLAIDGPWGSGKTVFLKMLAGHLRNNGFPVIEFDAFAHDYMEDAFTALAGEVVELTSKSGKAKVKKITEKAIALGKTLMRSSLKVAVSVATAGALKGTDIAEFGQAFGEAISEGLDKEIGEHITRRNKDRSTVEQFRAALTELSSHLVSEDESQKPLVFIIDELDRCRPTFALNILERAKHFFSVQGVHFIFGTNMRALESIVSLIYGKDIHAESYLQKFFNMIMWISLKTDTDTNSDNKLMLRFLIGQHQFSEEDKDFSSGCADFFGLEGVSKKLSLRTLKSCLFHVALIAASRSANWFRPPPLVAGLIALKFVNPSLYQKARRAELLFGEVEHALGLQQASDLNSDYKLRWARQMWRFATDRDFSDQDVEEVRREYFRYSLPRDRFELLSWMTHDLVDNFNPIERA